MSERLRNPAQPVAIVTGATSGIGSATARRLCADGFRVLLTGRSVSEGSRISGQLGNSALFVAADLTSPEAPNLLVDACLERFGRLDTLVNNAAVDHTGDLITTPMTEVRNTFEVNVFAALRMLQAAARAMTVGGTIINITSRLASIGVPTMAIYSASKGALLALTRCAAVELAPRNIRVNAVAPGMTRTPLYDDWVAGQADPVAVNQAVTAAIPLSRLATPSDVAGAVAYLASPEAGYITGTTITVDGGYTAQ